MISNHSEGTFGRLRYSLLGDHPSQPACLKLSPGRLTSRGYNVHTTRGIYHRCLHVSWRSRFHGSHLSCTSCTNSQYQATVKLHGVFPSCRGYCASSRIVLFHRVSRCDSARVVASFVRDGNYPTGNFATLSPLLLRPPFHGA